jgi:hypothetical protein
VKGAETVIDTQIREDSLGVSELLRGALETVMQYAARTGSASWPSWDRVG